MSIPRICYSPTITASACMPCSVDQLKALMNDPHVQEICDQIKLLDGNDHEEMSRLKRQLPIFTPQAQRFEDDKRHVATAISSGLVLLDVDKVEDPWGWWESLKRPIRVPFIAVTPSGHGIRAIAELLPGETIEQGQQRLADELGFSEYDSCTKDLSRASFVMPMSYVLYMDESIFEFPDQETADRIGNYPRHALENGTTAIESPDEKQNLATEHTPLLFHGVPYPSIVSHLITVMGGNPEYGERNTFYFTLVRYVRYIANFDASLVLQILPDFGLSEQERKQVITSAINRPRKSAIPDTVTRAVALAEAEQKADESNPSLVHSEADGKRVPERAGKGLPLPPLPHPLDIICKRLPEPFRPAMIIGSLPVLGTLATGIRFRYLDHAEHSFSFMSCITAPAATGKSFIRRPINLLLTPIDEQDEIEREKEQDYKDALRAAKNNKHQPENPRACPRNNGINISIAKLLQLLSYSDGKHLIGIGEEIDTLVKSEKAGVWSQKSDIYRLGFDNAKYGQNYMSDSSFSANVPVFYNLLLTGTPGGMYRFFKDVEDGLVTRFCFAQLPDMFGAEMPDFQDYTPREEEEVIRVARRLTMMSGIISCPAVDDAIHAWLEEKRQLAISTDSRAIDTIRRRAAVIGFRAGYLAALLNDETQSVRRKRKTQKADASAEFATWVAEYVFANQMELFGSQFEKVADDYMVSANARGHVRMLLQSLPETFTRSELMAARARNGQSTEVTYVISRWRSNGLIEEISPGKYQKLMP